ncbi:MAG: glutamyl-tRNA reductase [Chitinophaga sp.]|nr:glutamyl-tRNA reductase [Chitinophaga sp.]
MSVNQLSVIGINYKKSDAASRGKFAINTEQYISILQTAAQLAIAEIFVVSTCNRTEVYVLNGDVPTVIQLLCSVTEGDAESFKKLCYVKHDIKAIEHMFEVAAGLDSQILGDYEIVGQMKSAVRLAKENGMIGAYLERLFNTVLQSSKQIKTETNLSGGTVSVSFAAIRFLKEQVENIADKNILLIGTGKIGRNTCKNLVDYLSTKNITLINRSEDKANELANELGLQSAPFHELNNELNKADVVIVATNADEPFINEQNITADKKKVLIDLSIPNNIHPALKNSENITLVNVDELSKINDETLQMRLAEVPKAKAIIALHMQEFTDWNNMRKNVPAIKAVKQKLSDMNQCSLFQSIYTAGNFNNTELIQKVVNNMAAKMRTQHQPGCYYIEAINDFIAVTAN